MRRQDRGNRHGLQTFGEAAEATVKSLKRGVQRRHAQDAELIPPNGSDSIQYNLFAYFTDDSGDLSNSIERPRSWHRPLYAFRGGLRGAGASSTDSKIAANIERGF